MELTDDLKKGILNNVGPIIASSMAAGLVAAAGAAIAEMVATNYHSSTMEGDTSIKPTDDETTISKVETAATETEGKVAQDKVAASEGEVKASETGASAVADEATALESGATAARTKAGAADVETKALKMT
ncbi:MAG: hypothetical protein LBC72_03585 [Spirochaetaceae bacterium]|jgi:hypothetical protein|nr:hypothetical protein [Spirochaetaceae bacterium]